MTKPSFRQEQECHTRAGATPRMTAKAMLEVTVEVMLEMTATAILEVTVEVKLEMTVEAMLEVSVEAMLEVTVEAMPEVTVEAMLEVTLRQMKQQMGARRCLGCSRAMQHTVRSQGPHTVAAKLAYQPRRFCCRVARA